MTKRVTIEDVAKSAGVSISTVSNYLNKRYESMSTSTQGRIAKVIADLNYRPNVLAQGLKANKTRTVAAVLVNIGYPFCVSIMRSLTDVLSKEDYSLIVCETADDAERERKILDSLVAQQVDAIVIQTNGVNNDRLAEIAKMMPVVVVDREFSIPHIVNVITNNEASSEALTDALFDQGYERVLYVTESVGNISTRRDRLAGYKVSCEKHGRSPWIGWVNRSQSHTLSELAATLLEENPTYPFAVYTANGLIMFELFPHLKRLHYSTPDQMGLATYDDPDWGRLISPPLTSIRQPTEEVGMFSARVIIDLLESKNIVSKRQVKVMDSVLVLRESTARIG